MQSYMQDHSSMYQLFLWHDSRHSIFRMAVNFVGYPRVPTDTKEDQNPLPEFYSQICVISRPAPMQALIKPKYIDVTNAL